MTRGLLLALPLLTLAACAPDPASETPAVTDERSVDPTPEVPEADTLTLSADARALAERPTAPVRIEGACPFEGCTYGVWTTSAETTLYGRAADTTSATSTVPAGTTLTATDGFVLMTRLGEAVALRAGEVYVAFEEMRPVAAGDTLLVFEPEGEGSVRLWHAGTVGFSGTSAIEGPGVVDPAYRLVVEPEHQWWARVTTPDGRAGWLWMDRTPPVSGADALGG
jgi:hypothetical protein